MIHITVIDDDRKMQEYLSNLLKSILGELTVEIEYFEDGDNFLKILNTKHCPDILLCDIELPDVNGIDVGKVVRKKYPHVYLIYLTSHTEYAVESYRLDAYQYIIKDQIEERLAQVLLPLAEKIKREKSHFRIIGSDKEAVFYKDIISIYKEKGMKYIRYNTVGGEYRERISLDAIMRELDSNEFVLAERGYVINMKHIERIHKNTIFLDNGEQIILSSANIRRVKEYVHRYWRKC